MNLIKISKLVVLAALLLSATLSLASASAACRDDINPPLRALPQTKEWLGGDVGTSLELPDGRLFWIFGDSFVESRDATRSTSHFIHNSIGLSRINHDGHFEIQYFWKHLNNEPRSFFQPALEEESARRSKTSPDFHGQRSYRWPLSSFFAKDSLYIVLNRIHSTAANTLGFEIVGVDLVRIKNWRSNPEQWQQELSPLSDDVAVASPSAATVVDADFIYFFANLNTASGVHETIARLRRDQLQQRDLRGQLQYLKTDGSYSVGLKSVKPVLDLGNTELSVLKVGGLWYAVQMIKNRAIEVLGQKQGDPPEKLHTDQIILQTASVIAGPWSPPKVIYTPPETDLSSKTFQPAAFAYAAKAHATLECANGLPFAVSYVVNVLDPKQILKSPNLYRPEFVP